ncbi:MAG: type II toxin-antitoxin system RelE/ParE family toxin [Rhodomicrobium sp.]
MSAAQFPEMRLRHKFPLCSCPPHNIFAIMPWSVEFTETAAEEFAALAPDQRAHFQRIAGLIQDHGLERIHFPLVRHLEGPLWEIRLKGRGGVARALYVAQAGERAVVVRVFVKKTEKTPRREIEKALERAKELS